MAVKSHPQSPIPLSDSSAEKEENERTWISIFSDKYFLLMNSCNGNSKQVKPNNIPKGVNLFKK